MTQIKRAHARFRIQRPLARWRLRPPTPKIRVCSGIFDLARPPPRPAPPPGRSLTPRVRAPVRPSPALTPAPRPRSPPVPLAPSVLKPGRTVLNGRPAWSCQLRTRSSSGPGRAGLRCVSPSRSQFLLSAGRVLTWAEPPFRPSLGAERPPAPQLPPWPKAATGGGRGDVLASSRPPPGVPCSSAGSERSFSRVES